MEPKSHYSDPDRPSMSLCGVGYMWPSSVVLKFDPRDVTCIRCLDLLGRKSDGTLKA